MDRFTIGQRLGPYRIEALLGAGGMGVVYLAEDRELRRRVAIKVLDRARSAMPISGSLLHEARVAAALNHPSICSVHQVGRLGGERFIVMEHVDGKLLSTLIPEGRGLPLERALHYAIQIVDAVAHAHRCGIAHGDLKSGNVMITPDGRAKILDFGLAVHQSATPEGPDADTTWDCDLSSRAGTVPYMAPELLRGGSPDPRSDVWALGVLLYEMLSGHRPFAGKTAYELAAAILDDPPTPPPLRLPAPIRAVIARCLAKGANDRYASAAELAAALDGV